MSLFLGRGSNNDTLLGIKLMAREMLIRYGSGIANCCQH